MELVEPVVKFRSAFLPCFRTSMFLVCIVTLPMQIKLIGHGFAGLVATIVGLALGAVVLTIVLALVIPLFPVQVGVNGIRCYTVWGRYRTVQWSDMQIAGELNLAGMRYVKVTSQTLTSPMTVPLFLSNMRAFVETVRAAAGDEHVLTTYLLSKFPHPESEQSAAQE